MKKLVVLLAAFVSAAFAQSPVFHSGFEDNTVYTAPTGSSNAYGTFSGTDNSTGSSWPMSFFGANPGLTGILHVIGNPAPETVENYIANQIETVTGPHGISTKALKFNVLKSSPATCCIQDSLQMAGLSENVPEVYVRYWMKLGPEVTAPLPTSPELFWRSIFALKTQDDYRIEAYVYGDGSGTPYWFIHGDNNTGSGTYPNEEFWSASNTSVAVPLNQWFLNEFYIKRSAGGDGRVFWAVNGETLVDRAGSNIGVDGQQWNAIMYALAYGNFFPQTQWVDELEVFTQSPCGMLPCGQSYSVSQAVLEDFSSMRQNFGSPVSDLFNMYVGGTAVLENGMWKVTSDPTRGFDWQFYPTPYSGTYGFAQGWLRTGAPDPDYNRMKWRMKCDSFVPTSVPSATADLGTYVKPTTDTCDSCQGQHYYHSFSPNIHPDRWVFFTATRRPQNRVGGPGSNNWPDDPEWVNPTYGGPVHYYNGLTRFYFEIYQSGIEGSVCYFDDVTFEKVTGEPEDMVSSMTATHTGTRYEVGWATRKNETVFYDVRYSPSSMKVHGFESGTDGGTIENDGSDYSLVLWNSPNMAEDPSGMYVAIRPQGYAEFTEVYVPNLNSASSAPTITTASLPGGTVGASYSQTLQATGDLPITWAVTVGALPAGVTLDTNSGTISGTPTTAETQNFTVEATNASGSDTQALSITVDAVVAPTITTTSLPNGTVGVAYEETVQATGTAPITFSVVSGALPTGLSLNASTGVISGTPTTAETQAFTVQATNGVGNDTQALSITINSGGGGGGGGDPIAFVQAAAGANDATGNILVAFPGANTAGNAIIVVAGWASTAAQADGAVTDTQGNSYSLVGQLNSTHYNQSIGIWYAVNVAAGANTVTFNSPTVNSTLAIAEYSGVMTSKPATDGFISQVTVDGTTTPNSITSGLFTPTTNGDLIVGGTRSILTNFVSYTAGTGFTLRVQSNTSTNNTAIEDFTQAVAGQTSATFTANKNADHYVVAAAFKAAGGGGGGETPRRRVIVVH